MNNKTGLLGAMLAVAAMPVDTKERRHVWLKPTKHAGSAMFGASYRRNQRKLRRDARRLGVTVAQLKGAK